jgi:hypothetical protein
MEMIMAMYIYISKPSIGDLVGALTIRAYKIVTRWSRFTDNAAVNEVTYSMVAGLDSQRLMNYLRAIEKRYPHSSQAPYHNSTHATDVLQQMHLLLAKGGLAEVRFLALHGSVHSKGGTCNL